MEVDSFSQCLEYLQVALLNHQQLPVKADSTKQWYEAFTPVANGIIGLGGVFLGIYIKEKLEKYGKSKELSNKKISIQEEVSRLKYQAAHLVHGAIDCRNFSKFNGPPPTFSFPLKPEGYCLKEFFISIAHEFSPQQRTCAFHIISSVDIAKEMIGRFMQLFNSEKVPDNVKWVSAAINMAVAATELYYGCEAFEDNVQYREPPESEYEAVWEEIIKIHQAKNNQFSQG